MDGYKPLSGRAKLVLAALVLTILVDALAIVFDLMELRLLAREIDGQDVALSEFESSDSRMSAAATAQVVVFAVTVVVFLLWFSRAYRNIRALGAGELRFSPGWAVGAWFVPILNLWRPKQIANDIWRASEPEAPASQGMDWYARRTTPLLTVWWSLWLLSGVAARIYGATIDDETLEGLRSADRADVAALTLDAAAAMILIALVVMITRRQHDRYARLAARG